MNHADLQRMAEERIKDAQALINGSRWEFAYYSAGYAVECALKACFLRRMVYTGWAFDENVKKIDECRTHDFLKLVDAAGLKGELDNALKASANAGGEFATNWNKVRLWKVTSRYEPKLEAEARGLFAAITDDPYGVLKWIQNYW